MCRRHRVAGRHFLMLSHGIDVGAVPSQAVRQMRTRSETRRSHPTHEIAPGPGGCPFARLGLLNGHKLGRKPRALILAPNDDPAIQVNLVLEIAKAAVEEAIHPI